MVFGFIKWVFDRIPSDILGIIVEYLKEDKRCKNKDNLVTDKLAQELCKEMRGYKYLSWSAVEGRGLSQIFHQDTNEINANSSNCNGCKVL